MPRASRLPAKLLTHHLRPQAPQNGPRLWNAKEKIRTNVGLNQDDLRAWKASKPHIWFKEELKNHARDTKEFKEILQQWQQFRNVEPERGLWWQMKVENVEQYLNTHPQLSKLSADVQKFIINNPGLGRTDLKLLLSNPARYFSIPRNVPLEDRQQVYFPKVNDAVVLMRTPHLGPRYAAFDVPLHFNKLDLKDYLKSLYNVDVHHIRSTIVQAKLSEIRGLSRSGAGRKVRARSKKKMTVLLAKPFVYPEEIKNLSEWNHDEFWNLHQSEEKFQRLSLSQIEPDLDARKAIGVHARQIIRKAASKGRAWKPTWQEFEQDRRVMTLGLQPRQPVQPPKPHRRGLLQQERLQKALPTP